MSLRSAHQVCMQPIQATGAITVYAHGLHTSALTSACVLVGNNSRLPSAMECRIHYQYIG